MLPCLFQLGAQRQDLIRDAMGRRAEAAAAIASTSMTTPLDLHGSPVVEALNRAIQSSTPVSPNSSTFPFPQENMEGLVRGQHLGYGRLNSSVFEGIYNNRLVAAKVHESVFHIPYYAFRPRLSYSPLSLQIPNAPILSPLPPPLPHQPQQVYRICAPPSARPESRAMAPSRVSKHLEPLEMEVSKMAASLQHPNLVHYVLMTHKIVDEALTIFLLNEYCGGGTLAARLTDGGLPLVEVRRHTQQLLSALLYLHSHEIIHGDVRPGSVFFDSRCQVRLANFAVPAKLESVLAALNRAVRGRQRNGKSNEDADLAATHFHAMSIAGPEAATAAAASASAAVAAELVSSLEHAHNGRASPATSPAHLAGSGASGQPQPQSPRLAGRPRLLVSKERDIHAFGFLTMEMALGQAVVAGLHFDSVGNPVLPAAMDATCREFIQMCFEAGALEHEAGEKPTPAVGKPAAGNVGPTTTSNNVANSASAANPATAPFSHHTDSGVKSGSGRPALPALVRSLQTSAFLFAPDQQQVAPDLRAFQPPLPAGRNTNDLFLGHGSITAVPQGSLDTPGSQRPETGDVNNPYSRYRHDFEELEVSSNL